MIEQIFEKLALPIFIFLWALISYGVSFIGGWHKAQKVYGRTYQQADKEYYFCSGRIGLAKYSNSLIFGTNKEGLFICPLLLFRIGHKTLFFPWSDITVCREKMLVFSYINLNFLRVSDFTVCISARLGNKIIPEEMMKNVMEI